MNNDPFTDAHHRQMTICDGRGSILRLDLAQPGLDELANAFNALLQSKLPPGAYVIRVLAGDDVYLLRRVKRAPASIGLSRLGNHAQEVTLAEDVLQLVDGLLKSTRHLRSSASRAGVSLISFII